MSKKHKHKKKKPEITFKTWLVGAITDLFIGIALLLIQKLLE